MAGSAFVINSGVGFIREVLTNSWDLRATACLLNYLEGYLSSADSMKVVDHVNNAWARHAATVCGLDMPLDTPCPGEPCEICVGQVHVRGLLSCCDHVFCLTCIKVCFFALIWEKVLL